VGFLAGEASNRSRDLAKKLCFRLRYVAIIIRLFSAVECTFTFRLSRHTVFYTAIFISDSKLMNLMYIICVVFFVQAHMQFYSMSNAVAKSGSVCPSVRLSHLSATPTQFKLLKYVSHHTIEQCF